MKTLQLLVLALAVSLCSSCHLFYKRIVPQWQEAEVECPSAKAMYEVSALALEKAGFPVGGGADPAAMSLKTGWSTSESPWKGRGYRDRATVTFKALRPGWFTLETRVERETNESLRALEPEHAKWEAAPDNVEGARRVNEYIHSLLRSAEL